MAERGERVPRLTAREHWGRYAAGIGVEILYVVALGAVALVLAVIAKAVW